MVGVRVNVRVRGTCVESLPTQLWLGLVLGLILLGTLSRYYFAHSIAPCQPFGTVTTAFFVLCLTERYDAAESCGVARDQPVSSYPGPVGRDETKTDSVL